MSTAASIAAAEPRFADYSPGIGAGLSFAIADVLSKIVFASGMDVLSLITLRGILAAGIFWAWLRAAPPRIPHTPRARLISLGLGVLFSANVFGLLLAIQLMPLSVAILAYFIYPLLTGIAGAVLGIERLSLRGLATALVAFCGLALMLHAQPGALQPVGLIAAFGAAITRVISLLVTRAKLRGTEARLTTWYSLLAAAIVFLAASLTTRTFNPPLTDAGWFAFAGMGVTTTLSTFWIYVSTGRVGAFRTALVLNLEPILSTVFSVVLLGEVMTAPQVAGAVVMLVSLCMFQLRR